MTLIFGSANKTFRVMQLVFHLKSLDGVLNQNIMMQVQLSLRSMMHQNMQKITQSTELSV